MRRDHEMMIHRIEGDDWYATPEVGFTYDRLGRTATVSDAVGTRTLAYNADLQLDSETINGAGQGLYDKVVTRTYEVSGMTGTPKGIYTGFGVGPDAANWNADYQATYGFDATGRFNAVSGTGLPAGGVNYGYLADSDLIGTIQYKADATTVFAETVRAFESQRDLLASVENRWGATTVSKYEYTNDVLGRRTRVVNSGTAFDTYSQVAYSNYTYNPRNELIGAIRIPGLPGPGGQNNPPVPGLSYQYDPIGNRLTHTIEDGTPTDYTSNSLNQYTQTVEVPMAPETFTHDLDGNLTQDGAYAYTWDAENRLISVAPVSQPVTGDNKLTLTYDYRGRRVRKLVETWSGTAWQTADDLRFVYDDWNLVMELDGRSNNAILRKYAWGLDLSGTLHGAGGIGGLLATHDVAASKDYLYLYDANGNVGQLLDSNTGTLAAHYEYNPYGGTILSTGSYADTNSFRFSTKYYDGELNQASGPERSLYYYGYRYYSPRTGRWLNRDPVGEEGDKNLYRFLLNDALNYFDPTGQKPPCSKWTETIRPRPYVDTEKLHIMGDYYDSHRKRVVVKEVDQRYVDFKIKGYMKVSLKFIGKGPDGGSDDSDMFLGDIDTGFHWPRLDDLRVDNRAVEGALCRKCMKCKRDCERICCTGSGDRHNHKPQIRTIEGKGCLYVYGIVSTGGIAQFHHCHAPLGARIYDRKGKLIHKNPEGYKCNDSSVKKCSALNK